MTTTQPETPTIEPITGGIAEITTVQVGLPATHRCARCAAQAYVEVQMPSGLDLLFCGHHYTRHEEALAMQAKRIIDHRPFIAVQEAAFKGQPVK